MAAEEASTHHAGPAVPPEAVGSLRKLKETEALWLKRLEEARSRGETKIKYAQAARERALDDAHRAADEARSTKLREARTQADVEARKIVEEAKGEVARIGTPSGSSIDERMEEILSAIFGDLRSTGGSRAASSTKAASAAPSKGGAALPAR